MSADDLVQLRGGRVEHLSEWAYVSDQTMGRFEFWAAQAVALATADVQEVVC